jgi:hypothetical protein
MENELIKLLADVHDEQSFLKFVEALITDRVDEVEKEKTKPSSPYGAGANGWENIKIETFLEAATAWASSSNFGRKNREGQFEKIAGTSSHTFYTQVKFTNNFRT